MKSIRRQVNFGRDAGKVEIRAERFLSNFFPGFHSEDVTDQWQRCRYNMIIRLLSHGTVHTANSRRYSAFPASLFAGLTRKPWVYKCKGNNNKGGEQASAMRL